LEFSQLLKGFFLLMLQNKRRLEESLLQKFTSLFVVTYLSMSKIGKKPIAIPQGVTVTVDKSLVSVK
jgi:hypothetical protein